MLFCSMLVVQKCIKICSIGYCNMLGSPSKQKAILRMEREMSWILVYYHVLLENAKYFIIDQISVK